MNRKNRATRSKNTDALVKSGGEITIGRIGPVLCGATAANEDQSLAMLVCQPEECLGELLDRLDKAIVKAWDKEEYTDGINR